MVGKATRPHLRLTDPIALRGYADALRYMAGCAEEAGGHPDEETLAASVRVPSLLRALAGAADDA